MDTTRIAELLAPFLESPAEGETPLTTSQLDQVSIYLDLLLRWNRRINLTAIRNEEEIIARHFGESFFLARHLLHPLEDAPNPCHSDSPNPCHPDAPKPCHPERSLKFATRTSDAAMDLCTSPPEPAITQSRTITCVIDVGSGAGFPALPLKIWAPQIHLTMIESNHKKAAFLREVVRALSMTNVNVLADRAEILAASPDHPLADIVTLRAVERFETILPQAASFVAPQGRLALLIGSAQLPSLASLTTFQWQAPIHIPESHLRLFVIGVLA